MATRKQDKTGKGKPQAAPRSRPLALESYFDTSQEAAFTLDLNGTLTYANQKALDLVGYEIPEIMGRPFHELPIFTPESLRLALELFDRNRAGESVGPNPMELVKKDGGHAWVVLFGNTVAGPSGELVAVTMNDITVPKRTEDRLREERNRSKQYLDIARTMLLALDRDGRVTLLNRRGCEILRGEEKDFMGKDWFATFIPAEHRTRLRNTFDRMMAGERIPYEHVAPHPVITLDGRERIVEWHNSLVRDEHGFITGTLGSGEDMTERLIMEKTLREMRELDTILLDNAPNQVMMFNPDMSIRYVNPSWEKLNGWTSEEVVGIKPPFPWWPQAEQDTFTKDFINSFGTGPASGEIISFKKNGDAYWLAMSWTPVKTDGRLDYWLINSIEITERKRAEQSLLESEERYRTLISSSNDGIVSANHAMEITLWNHAAETILGYSEAETLGHSLLEIVPDRSHETVGTAFKRFHATGEVTGDVLEVSAKRKDGTEVPIELSVSTAVRNGEPMVTAILRDITKRKEAADALEESQERFSKAFNVNPAAATITAADDGTFIEVNNRFTEALGYAREEAVGRTSLEMGAWANPDDRQRMVRLLKNEGHVRNEEFDFRTKSGKIRTFLLSAEPLNVAGRDCLISSWFDITERKEARAALLESEERFAKAFNASPASVVITSVDDGRYIEVNKGFTELQGYTRDEVLGHTSLELGIWLRESERERVVKLLNEHGRLRNHEVEYRCKSGEIRTFSLSSEFITVAGEKCIISSSFDITEGKKAQEALHESRELLSKAFNASPDAICITAIEDGTYLEVNNGFTEMLDYPRSETIGRTSQELGVWVHPSDRLRMVRLLTKRGRVRNNEYEFRTKSGEVRNFLLSAERITVAGKDCIISSSFDITERKQAENLLKTLADSSPIGVYIAQDGIFKHVNRRLVDILNQPLDKLIHARTIEFVLPNDRVMTRKNAIAMLKGERSHPYAYRVVDEAGETRYVMETVAPIIYEGKRAVLGNLMDVTQMEIMQDELRRHRDHLEELVSQRTTELTAVNRRLEDELVHRQEVEAALVQAKEAAEVASQAKSEFLAHMSHEIRTPIHGMIGMINLALDCRHEAERRQYLGMALSSADALQSVINDILDLSKIEAGQLEMLHEDFNLLTVVEDATEVLAPLAFKKGLELTVHLAPDVPTAVNGDAGHLRQVITNLLGNAIKFTLHGEVALRVEKIANHRTTTEVLFSVRDTGIGIPENKQQAIFDPFNQADGSINREYGGTGLGLAISRHLVRNMRGRLWMSSEPGHGSVFYFTATFDKGKPSRSQHTRKQAPEFAGHTALVVVPNETGRTIIADLLTRLGFTVTTAANSQDACRLLEQQPEHASDLIIIDRTLPDQDGVEAAARLKSLASQPSCIMLLPPDNLSMDHQQCQQAGFPIYLVKPVRVSKVYEAVRSAMGLAPLEPAPMSAMPAPADGPRLRILVAEDNATSQLVARKMLEKMGHTVSVASNGLEATRLAETGTFDLILMDAEMPIVNGLEATRRIRRSEASTKRHLPIIAMTAYAMKSDRDQCLEAGMDAYLSKPAKPNEINDLIKSFFSRPKHAATTAVVDMNEAMKMFGTDVELLYEAARIFMEQDYPEQMTAIHDGITRQDAEAVRMAAHSIKGAAWSLGSHTLGDVALRLEEAGRNGNLSHAAALITEMEREAARLADYFAAGATR